MQATSCLPSGWCDFSEEHRRVRETAESLVESYAKGSGDEYWMAVVVAPYGSGKTTLLRHLEWFARERLGAQAARIEFARLVEYITETRGSIHESELPGIVEEFAEKVLGAEPGKPMVLLVDEIEESYDIFRGIVEHETTPLRGLAEAVRTHSTWVYPVLAFGPSSTLKEAVFGPVAWRSRVLSIPLLPRSVIAAELRSRGVKGEEAELLANMVWWASKGRIAWARMLMDTVVPRLLEVLGETSPEKLEALLLGDESLSREIVEGTPLFDRRGYRDVKRFLDNKRLLPVLAVLVGPAPLSLVEKAVASPVVPEAGPVLGFTRSMVSVEDMVAETEAWMEKIARARGYRPGAVEHAVSALEHVLSAWSLEGRIPFDPQALRELFSLAADVAREVYGDEPQAAQLLETLNPDMLVPEVTRAREPVVYIRPSMLARIYPVASSSPLVGCARHAGLSQVVDVVESIAPEEAVRYSDAVAKLLGLEEPLAKRGLRLLMAPRPLLPGLRDAACGRAPCVLLVADPRERRTPGGEALPAWLRAAKQLGVTRVAEAGPRLSLFIYSLFYSLALGTHACSLDTLDAQDRRLLGLYGDMVKTLVLDAAQEAGNNLLEEAEEKLRLLEKRLGDQVVAAAAWLISRLGPRAARRRAEELDEKIARAGRALARIARLLGAEAPQPSAYRPAVEELVSLHERLPREAGELAQCLGASGPLAVLLGGAYEPRARGLAEKAERALEAAKALPSAGVVSAATEALRGLLDALGSDAALVEAALPDGARLVAMLSERLRRLVEAYSSATAGARLLPQSLRERLEKAIEEDVSRIRSLDELASYIGMLSTVVKDLVEITTRSSMVEEVEERRSRILSLIDDVLVPQVPQAGEAEAVAEAR